METFAYRVREFSMNIIDNLIIVPVVSKITQLILWKIYYKIH